MNISRTLKTYLARDLDRKIVMIGGPRQVGKTTLAKTFINNDQQYLTWDDLSDRKLIRTHDIDTDLEIIVLDEIHKYARWRMLLKGLYDKFHDHLKIIVTGSARLDHLRKGGDSLFGRFFYYRLHPLTVREALNSFPDRAVVQDLLKFGGFPEPFLLADSVFLKRWQQERKNRVIYQDINELSMIREISLIEVLVDLLPDKVGSLLSINSLQEDLEVSPNTVANWIKILEQVYYCYRIYPYGTKKIRALKKSAKLYLWDWSELEDEGARWENFVASHLLKFCHFLEDTEGRKMELRYLKDVDGREIDFVVLDNKKPLFAVECKTKDRGIADSIYYYRERTNIPKFYQVHLGEKTKRDRNIVMLPFIEFCRLEQIP